MLGCMNAARIVAQRALGHPLPPEAVVHHVNGVNTDNRRQNLVICQDREYHRLLHHRMAQKGYKAVQKHYLLRDVDPEFWEELKAKARKRRIKLRTLIIRLLTDYVDYL